MNVTIIAEKKMRKFLSRSKKCSACLIRLVQKTNKQTKRYRQKKRKTENKWETRRNKFKRRKKKENFFLLISFVDKVVATANQPTKKKTIISFNKFFFIRRERTTIHPIQLSDRPRYIKTEIYMKNFRFHFWQQMFCGRFSITDRF